MLSARPCCIMKEVATHFQPEALKFLRGLVRHNDREWFEARRMVYQRALKAPMLALIEELNGALVEFAPEHVRTPQKTMLRIHRDTRFSNDKRPYKRHVAAWFGRRGAVRTTGPGFYLQISPVEVQVAAGVFMPLPEHLLAIRQWLADNHAQYEAALKQATKAQKGRNTLQPVDANSLTRMPKGFAAEHPAGDFLRARRWGVHGVWPAGVALEPGFRDLVAKAMRAAEPVVRALDQAIDNKPSGVARKRAKPMF